MAEILINISICNRATPHTFVTGSPYFPQTQASPSSIGANSGKEERNIHSCVQKLSLGLPASSPAVLAGHILPPHHSGGERRRAEPTAGGTARDPAKALTLSLAMVETEPIWLILKNITFEDSFIPWRVHFGTSDSCISYFSFASIGCVDLGNFPSILYYWSRRSS